MDFFRSESGKKALIIGALVVLLGVGFVSQRHQAVEDAKKVCAVCAAQGDTQRKAVAQFVSFNDESYAVHSKEHAAEFKKNPAFFAGKLHEMGLHEH